MQLKKTTCCIFVFVLEFGILWTGRKCVLCKLPSTPSMSVFYSLSIFSYSVFSLLFSFMNELKCGKQFFSEQPSSLRWQPRRVKIKIFINHVLLTRFLSPSIRSATGGHSVPAARNDSWRGGDGRQPGRLPCVTQRHGWTERDHWPCREGGCASSTWQVGGSLHQESGWELVLLGSATQGDGGKELSCWNCWPRGGNSWWWSSAMKCH